MKQGVTSVYLFGSFELDPNERLFTKDSEPIPLTPRAFDVLEILVQNAGHLVEKEEFLSRIWDDAIVEEANLARIIYTLRRTLGNGDEGSKYIQTVAKRGYRFVAEVERQDRSGNDHILEKTEVSNQSPLFLSKRTMMWTCAILILMMIPLFGFVFRGGTSAEQTKLLYSAENLTLKRLTQTGNVYGFVISPDRQYFAYIALNDKEQGLVIRQMSTGTILNLVPPIKGTSYWSVSFAPDNSFIYYTLKEPNVDSANLYRIPLLGGEPTLIIQNVGSVIVSPDGKSLATIKVDRGANRSQIIVTTPEGKQERIVHTNPDLDSGYYSVTWSPDGRKLLISFMKQEPDHKTWYIAEIPSEGGPETRIGERSDFRIGNAIWLPDMTGIITNEVDETSKLPQIFYRSYPDGKRRRITNDLNYYQGISMTADGGTIVAMQTKTDRNIWSVTNGSVEQPLQLTEGVDKHFDTVRWVGNDYIYYDLDENGTFTNYNLWRMRTDGSEDRQITFGMGNNRQPAVSPDGRNIVYVSKAGGRQDLWIVDADGGEPRQVTNSEYNPFNPNFSADGQTIYFDSLQDGVESIMSVPSSGGNPSQIVRGKIWLWAISPDGKQLAYATERTGKAIVCVLSLDGSRSEHELEINADTFLSWSPDGKFVEFNTQSDESKNIWRKPLAGGKAFPVTTFKNGRIHRFAWSKDAKTLAVIRQFPSYDAMLLTFEPGNDSTLKP
ncbi:MAG: winged helix-turn-helix domain-containing protein [Pyrinomonadaceae bacterium]